MLVLWLVCLTGVTVVGIQLAQDFEYDGKQTNRISVVQPVAGPLILQVDDSEKTPFEANGLKAATGNTWKCMMKQASMMTSTSPSNAVMIHSTVSP